MSKCIVSPPIIFSVLVLMGCRDAIDGYIETAHFARVAIPEAKEMETLFGQCDHIITQYAAHNSKHEWHTVAYFGDRYELTMFAGIDIDYHKRKFTVTGKPRFVLREIRSIDVSNNGVVSSSMGEEVNFGVREWKNLVASKGNIECLGINVNHVPVKHFSQYRNAWSQPRVPINLSKMK